MSNADFGNRADQPTPDALRASIDRALAECDRQAALPAGHPELLRAFEHGRRRLIVPASVTSEQIETLERLAYGDPTPSCPFGRDACGDACTCWQKRDRGEGTP